MGSIWVPEEFNPSPAIVESLVPGERYSVSVAMNGVAHSFQVGHRIRLSVSTSYWPLAWPSPEPVRLEVQAGTSYLRLPIRPIGEMDEVTPRPFDPPEGAEPLAVSQVEPTDNQWLVSRDLVDYRSALEVVKDLGTVRFDDIDLEVTRRAYEKYGSKADDFDSIRGETDWLMRFRRGDWVAETRTRTTLTSTVTEFHVHAQLDAYEGEQRIRSHNWRVTVPRDHV